MNNIRRFKNITTSQLGIQQLFPHRIADVVRFNSSRFVAPGQIVDLAVVTSRANSEMSDKLLGAVNNGFIQPVESALGAKDAFYPGATLGLNSSEVAANILSGAIAAPADTVIVLPAASSGVQALTQALLRTGADVNPFDDNIGVKLSVGTFTGLATALNTSVLVNGLPVVVGKIYYFKSGDGIAITVNRTFTGAGTLTVTPVSYDAQLVPATPAAGIVTSTAGVVTFS